MGGSEDLKSRLFKHLWQAGLFYSALAIVLIPGPLDFLGWQKSLADALLLPLLKFAGGFFYQTENWIQEISSDSSFMWLLLALVVPFSMILGFRQKHNSRLMASVQIVLTYFLAFVLLNYGVDKVFKAQFYLPEPNILFTPFGMLDKDILYWSTMGISYEYNLFLGWAEVLAAMLLLVRKTRVIGLILALGILVNVVAVNFSFDISVKALSLLLLLISVVLLAPFARSFLAVFSYQENAKLTELPTLPSDWNSSKIQVIAKVIIIGIALIQSILPFWQNGVYNDDLAERPFLHGAYEVTDSSDPNLKMIFIHRDGYLIFQDNDFRMKDYKLEIDPIEKSMNLIDYNREENILHYTYNGTTGELRIANGSNSFYAISESVNWRELPALKPQMHLSID
ncbi:hypothetical protein O3Q51_06195 [Cryomorphaceae bacterium 1068]|nr:hypothetical protein [Cryomorphaceae bacterium 1068]